MHSRADMTLRAADGNADPGPGDRRADHNKHNKIQPENLPAASGIRRAKVEELNELTDDGCGPMEVSRYDEMVLTRPVLAIPLSSNLQYRSMRSLALFADAYPQCACNNKHLTVHLGTDQTRPTRTLPRR